MTPFFPRRRRGRSVKRHQDGLGQSVSHNLGPAPDEELHRSLEEGTGVIYGVTIDVGEDGCIRLRSRDPRMFNIESSFFDCETGMGVLIHGDQVQLYPPSMRVQYLRAAKGRG